MDTVTSNFELVENKMFDLFSELDYLSNLRYVLTAHPIWNRKKVALLDLRFDAISRLIDRYQELAESVSDRPTDYYREILDPVM
jgi:hypothetical protein